jgi:CDP-6-deoxy-D-xylo-4-hexulose-3-dehydrase
MWKLQENILEKQDKEHLIRFITKTERFTQFDKVKEFESKWSKWQQIKYSVFVNSGSSANLLLVDAIKEYYKIPDGAEVIVSSVTWITNITSVIQNRLKPVIVDINLDDLSFDYKQLEKSITPKTRIIFVTHLIGIPANMSKIMKLAKKYNLIVLEDCCESHGARFKYKKVGNFGLAGTFSFYWGHHMTTIEGGTICTNNKKIYHLLLLKRSHGLARELPTSEHNKLKKKYSDINFNFLFLTHGYNFRNTELHAMVGIEQLRHLDRYIDIRKKNYQTYLRLIQPIKERLYIINQQGISPFCLPFIFKDQIDRDKFKKVLKKFDVEYRPIISGNLLRQPCFRALGDYRKLIYAEIAHKNGLYIGNNQFVDARRMKLLQRIINVSF